MTLFEMVRVIGDAIERQEGYGNKRGMPTRAQRNNNPGNIWDGLCLGKAHRIWPEYPIDGAGFLILPSYAVGRALMDGQVKRKIRGGETLRKAINEWDSSDPQANRDTYVANVSAWTGLPTDVELQSLITT